MKISLLLLFLVIFTWSNAHAELAGVVLLSKGKTYATDQNGKLRNLKRRSSIFEGDVLATAKNGKLQIRFIDKGLLTLKANSELNVTSYQLAKIENADEKVVMNLIKGGFRTITGSIGKGEKSAYTVKTPAASIGIRGTNYEVAQEKNGKFVIAVWEGGVTVSNEKGSIDVGSNAEFDFVRVSPDEEPEGLDEQPASLNEPSQTAPEDSSAKEESESDSGDDESEQTEEQNNEGSTEQESEKENTALNGSDDAEQDVTTIDAAESSESTAQTNSLNNELGEAEQIAIAILNAPPAPLSLVSSPDVRFDDTQYTYLLSRPRAGLLVNDDGTIDNALMVQDSNNDLIVSLPGSGTGSLNLDTFPLDVSDANNTLFDASVDGSNYVSWGRWDGVISLTDNTSTTTTPTKNFYWLSAEAANLSSLRGSAKFSGSSGIGDVNGSNISSINGSLDVNFANGNIENGNLNFSGAGQDWAVTFDGSVTGVNATMTNIDAVITGAASCSSTCLDASNIQGIFAYPGDRFVGGFNLDSTTATSSTATGLFSLKKE